MTTQHLVPAGWRDDFVLALRLRGVTGAQIGDALAHVESYCAESGETADESFGDAGEYARSLPLAAAPATSSLARLGTLVRTGVSLAGVFVTTTAVAGWVAGETPALRLGPLVAVLVVTVAAVLLTSRLALVVRHPWLGGLALALAVAAVVAALLLLDDPLLSVPPVPMTVLGVLLLVGPSIWATGRGVSAQADVVASPLDDPQVARRANERSDLVVAWIIPLAAVPVVVVAALAAATS